MVSFVHWCYGLMHYNVCRIGKNVLSEDGDSTLLRNVGIWLHGVIIQKIVCSMNLNVNLMNCVNNFYVHIFRIGLRYIFFRNNLKCNY